MSWVGIEHKTFVSHYIGKVSSYPQLYNYSQELLFASTSRLLLAASCGSLALGSCKPQELLCGRIFKTQELLAVGFSNRNNFFVLTS